jgi:AcrR family transcriptional regulator
METDILESPESNVVQACSTADRILGAAFNAFIERGFAETSTLEIATRAKVSKRELYALFGSKQAILVACIAYRVERIKLPSDLPAPNDPEALKSVLTLFGSILLREICRPSVIALYRLAVAEIDRSPEVARTLIAAGRETTFQAIYDLLAHAHSAGLLAPGELCEMARQYLSLLTGNLMVALMLRDVEIPPVPALDRHAQKATSAFLLLNAPVKLQTERLIGQAAAAAAC